MKKLSDTLYFICMLPVVIVLLPIAMIITSMEEKRRDWSTERTKRTSDN